MAKEERPHCREMHTIIMRPIFEGCLKRKQERYMDFLATWLRNTKKNTFNRINLSLKYKNSSLQFKIGNLLIIVL